MLSQTSLMAHTLRNSQTFIVQTLEPKEKVSVQCGSKSLHMNSITQCKRMALQVGWVADHRHAQWDAVFVEMYDANAFDYDDEEDEDDDNSPPLE